MTPRSTSFLRAGSQFDLKSMTRLLCDELQSRNSRILAASVMDEDWGEVAQISALPSNYTSALEYFKDVIPTLFKKAEDLPLGVDRVAAAREIWWQSEHMCYRSNQRLYPFLHGKIQRREEDKDVYRHLDGIRKIIRSWIGYQPSLPEMGFSPGSTLTDRGYLSTVAHKISKDPSSTTEYDSLGYPGFIGTLWHHNMVDAGRIPSLSRGGEFFTVPKTSLVDRCAELQPSLNMSAQLGAGRDLRKRLKRTTKWDLTRAQDVHREVARKASVDQSFCTIDLSSASDCVGKVLVELLFPEQWFIHLDGLRTHRMKGVSPTDGEKYVLLEKFSSMGNGFTFELETIIFAAVACYVTRCNGYYGELGFDVFVYGDDIIVRDELFTEVKAVLEFLGFKTNQSKSFSGSSPFRESCGGDFFLGENVRPIYLGVTIDLTIQEQITAVNQIYRLSQSLQSMGHPGLNRLWFSMLSHLPRWVRDCRGPERFGDSVIHDLFEGAWVTKVVDRYKPILDITFQKVGVMKVSTVYLKTVGFLPGPDCWIPWHRFDPATVLACATLGFGDGLSGLLPRDPTVVPEVAWVVLGTPSTREA